MGEDGRHSYKEIGPGVILRGGIFSPPLYEPFLDKFMFVPLPLCKRFLDRLFALLPLCKPFLDRLFFLLPLCVFLYSCLLVVRFDIYKDIPKKLCSSQHVGAHALF